MTQQIEFVLDKEGKSKEQVTHHCRALIYILRRNTGWMHASEIKRVYGWTPRYTRLLASQATGAIISGNDGYRLTSMAEPEEVKHFINRTRSQATELDRRALDVQRYYHSYGSCNE